MQDREIACIHYVREGECDLGHKGTFRKACQKCKQYSSIPGGRPARKNNRRQKNERYNKKEMVKLVKQY